jgi:hypothetical protein
VQKHVETKLPNQDLNIIEYVLDIKEIKRLVLLGKFGFWKWYQKEMCDSIHLQSWKRKVPVLSCGNDIKSKGKS